MERKLGQDVLSYREWREVVHHFEDLDVGFPVSEVHVIAEGVVLARESVSPSDEPRWAALWHRGAARSREVKMDRGRIHKSETLEEYGVGLIGIDHMRVLDEARQTAFAFLVCTKTDGPLIPVGMQRITY